MENFKFIEFHRTRDFSKKLNVTFEFVQQNFKPLGKSILLLAGPPVLIASLIMGSFMNDFISFFQSAAINGGDVEGFENYFTSVYFWLQVAVMIVFLTISSVMNIATINNYILLYGEKQSNKIEVSEVWERVRATFGMYFGTTIIFVVLAVAAYVVLLIPVGILAALSPVLIFFAIVFCICAIVYLTFGASLTFFIRAYEKSGFFEALIRSFKLVKNKWWSTFGLIMVLYLIMSTISSFLNMPWYLIMMTSALHNVSEETFKEPSTSSEIQAIFFFALSYLGQMVLMALPAIGIAFQYFNLVELKEAKGLMTQIEGFGQPQSQPPQDEHY